MPHTVKLKIQPNQPVTFPGICVHTGEPASEWHTLRKRNGRFTRTISVPISQKTARHLSRRSQEEERYQRLGLIGAGGIFFVAFGLTLILTPAAAGFGLRLLLALAVAYGLAYLTYRFFQRTSQRAALPEKQAILAAAAIADFSWRTTTFSFANEAFAKRFEQLNHTLLMDDARVDEPNLEVIE